MPAKDEIQTILKEKYGINKNITQPLSHEDCESLLVLLHNKRSAVRLVESLVEKNQELSKNNRFFGQRRSQAEAKLDKLQQENQQLERAIAEMEKANDVLGNRKSRLSTEQQELENEIQRLTSQTQRLNVKVNTLSSHNEELIEANDELKRDNKELKNHIDQIRLRLARDMKTLLQYEDSEIRKAMIRLLRWSLG